MIRYSILLILYFLFATPTFATNRDSTFKRWNYGLELNTVLVPKTTESILGKIPKNNNVALGLRFIFKYNFDKN